jgi:hypothetical protein
MAMSSTQSLKTAMNMSNERVASAQAY